MITTAVSSEQMENMQRQRLEEKRQRTIDGVERANELWCGTMRIPKRFHGKFVSNYEGNAKQVKIAVDAVRDDRSVFLHGICGTGKTHLAVGLVMEWLKAGKFKLIHPSGMVSPCILGAETENKANESIKHLPFFLPSAELFLELKSSFDNRNTSELEIMDKYSRCPLLVIDDISTEKVSDWSRQVFYTLIDRRYREMSQTIITTNKTPDEIAKIIDDRIMSRIFGMGEVIELKGVDRRTV